MSVGIAGVAIIVRGSCTSYKTCKTTIMLKDKEIPRQSATIKEQGDMLRSIILLLLNAVNLGVEVKTVKRYGEN